MTTMNNSHQKALSECIGDCSPCSCDMNSEQQKALVAALERIVICEAIAMDLRQRALQGIEDLEMGSAADKMTIRDVHSFTHNSPLHAAHHDYWDQQDA